MYGASSSIVVSMLTPFARRVISRTRRLNRSKAFGAITRLTSGPAVKLNPRNFRACGRTLRLIHLELELLRDELRDAGPLIRLRQDPHVRTDPGLRRFRLKNASRR